MKQTRWLVLSVLVAGLVAGYTGCTGVPDSPIRPRSAARTFALAVTVNGGSQPSPEQWSALRGIFTEMLGKRGYTLVENAVHAANIIHVNFVTPPGNPLAGTAVVLAIEQTPPPLSTGYPGAGAYGPSRITLASLDPVLGADHTIYLAPKGEGEIPAPRVPPDSD